MLWWILGAVVVIVALVGGLLVAADASAKRAAREAELAKGNALGTWTVFYDVPGRRIGLSGTFGERDLLRYLLLRAHDLFEYNQGLENERRALADALRAASRGNPGEPWTLLFPVPESECFHAHERPDAKLFKYFDGTLFEHAITQPRFLGGDSIAKQKGLVGECVAIAAHLSGDPARSAQVARAIDRLVQRELAEGTSSPGAKFWDRPNDALRQAGA
ncbi:hypothetical protein [Sandaracinus amylolyticus]|uniref:hypothetical protein n=1 Tax=Sandaracinus amylolyticus TaxID=927083 RepID=UPI001F3B4DC3|nr:hypothetical protein [Sandaracinus amylolyticus]UJR80242.1 Hypothetical protein I5071_22860 [Sandaracinus amylolyticus]